MTERKGDKERSIHTVCLQSAVTVFDMCRHVQLINKSKCREKSKLQLLLQIQRENDSLL